jgi:hypothetical protein
MSNDAVFNNLLDQLYKAERTDLSQAPTSLFMKHFREALIYYNKYYSQNEPGHMFLSRSELGRIVLNVKIQIEVQVHESDLSELASIFARNTFKALKTMSELVPEANNVDIIDSYCKDAYITLKYN